jgi:hypothetical protein
MGKRRSVGLAHVLLSRLIAVISDPSKEIWRHAERHHQSGFNQHSLGKSAAKKNENGSI